MDEPKPRRRWPLVVAIVLATLFVLHFPLVHWLHGDFDDGSGGDGDGDGGNSAAHR